MEKPNLKTIALLRANGKNSKQIGEHYNLSREHIRQYWFSQLNQKTLNQIENIITGKMDTEELIRRLKER